MPFKRLLAVFCAWFALFCCAALPACAEDVLNAALTLSDTDFEEPGETRLSLTLSNRAGKAISDVKLLLDDRQLGETIASINAGESVYREYAVNVSKKHLDAGRISFTVSYKYAGKTQKEVISAPVHMVKARAKAFLSCHIGKTNVYAGETVTAEYRIINIGSVPILSAVIEDAAPGFRSQEFDLAAGEEKTFIGVFSVHQNFISSPRASFISAESGARYAISAGNTAVRVAEDSVSIKAFALAEETACGAQATIEVIVENIGLLEYTAVSLSESSLGRIPDVPASLRQAESFTCTVTTPCLTASRDFVFRLEAREVGGAERSFYSEPVKVAVSEANDLPISLSVKANTFGDAPFTIRVAGAGRDLRNVTLCEETLGDVKTFAVIQAGEETVFRPILSAAQGETYRFSLQWTENGARKTCCAEPTQALLTTNASTVPAFSGSNAVFYAIVHTSGLSNTILIYLVAIILILTASLIAYKIHKVKKRKKEKREALGRTGKFIPVRAREAEKEK